MAFVLDASVTLAWAFGDGQNAVADHAEQLLKTGAETAFVPDLWWYEIRNILVVGERRGRISAAETTAFLSDISQLRIAANGSRRDELPLKLARQHKLTVYDAAYLALAMREHLPLATLNKNLAEAAVAEGIKLLG